MNKDCSTCICKEGSCYPSTTIFDKDKICKSYDPDYEGYIAELEKENAELKTKKIPQLERRIASIRGSHRVDIKKLNARIEQVERLKKENAELKTVIALKDEEMGCIETDFNTFKSQAKEIIRDFISVSIDYIDKEDKNYSCIVEAEQFLKDNA